MQTLTLTQDVLLSSGEVLPAQVPGEDVPIVNPDGSVQRDNESGEVIMMPGEMQANEIPAYKPHGFPIVERINIAASDKFWACRM